MIIVRVGLLSAVDGNATELARMHICNRGDHPNPRMGNYEGQTFIGRNTEALNRARVLKAATLENFPRQALHVWNLVNRMLTEMGYSK